MFLWSEKLPFAGYSIVKECLKLSSYQPYGCQPVERRTSHRSDFALRLGRTGRCFVAASFSQSFSTHDRRQVPCVALSVGQNFLFYDSRSPDASTTETVFAVTARRGGLPPVARSVNSSWPTVAFRYGGHPSPNIYERRVENTGLEPVTSWLQTRRSPS